MLKWFWGIKRHLISSWRVDFSCKHRTHTEARCWFILREVRHNVSPWGSPRRSSRDGPVTFSHALCVVTQVTQLVLAELCDVLRPGQQHVWHTQTQTHTHAVSTWPLDDTPPLWPYATTAWMQSYETKRRKSEILFLSHPVSEMQICLCSCYWLMGSRLTSLKGDRVRPPATSR